MKQASNENAAEFGTIHWHAQTSAAVGARLAVDPEQGLTSGEAAARLGRLGENRLTEKPARSAWLALADQFKSVLILVLLAAAVLAGVIGDTTDAAVILLVVVVNALLGFWQEHRAEATLAALKKMSVPVARVRRDGRVTEVPATQVVPGDVVLLEAGDRVPVDGRVLAAHNAEVAEAALTGESQPVTKVHTAEITEETPLAERCTMAYMHTVVTRGRLELIVTATGMATEMGRLAGLLESTETGPTPLQTQLNGLGTRLTWIAGAVIGLILLLGLARGLPLVETLLTSIALAVAAIPEGLPAVVTVSLALGMRRMARSRAIVKKLAAVETLGCTTVICADKTGTLTLNQMTARAVYFRGCRFAVSGEGYATAGAITADAGGVLPAFEPLLRSAVLANDSTLRDGQLIGDPTEGALLVLAVKGGFEAVPLRAKAPRCGEIPFDSDRKFMATFHRTDADTVLVCVKGAPEVLVQRCTRWWTEEGVQPLAAAARDGLQAANAGLAEQAMRVLAMATREIPAGEFEPDGDLMSHVRELVFVGLVGILDPPRAEAREAIRLCREAGIRVKMITGDHPLTAVAVARELGLEGEVLTGAELDALPVAELSARIDSVAVFARVAPEHKVKIVQSLQARGEVVAMTGDGVNDAPALKQADIGVAMGRTGTEVAKEAATMVLTDDNFATIVGAVEEGRGIYDNIVKFVRFQLSTNLGAIQTVLGASLLGWASPFNAIQLLWINIIMDGPPAMSLGVEPSQPGLMGIPPRAPSARILTRQRFERLFVQGLFMATGTLGLFRYAQPLGHAYAVTLAFTTFVLFQFYNVFNSRSEHASIFNANFFRNRWLWLSLGAVLALQVVVVHWGPAQRIFHTTAIAPAHWGLAALVACSVLVAEEVRKLASRWWGREKLRSAHRE